MTRSVSISRFTYGTSTTASPTSYICACSGGTITASKAKTTTKLLDRTASLRDAATAATRATRSGSSSTESAAEATARGSNSTDTGD